MTTTETTEAPATTRGGRVKALRDSIVNHIDGITASGRTMIASRRDERRRDELLRELGEVHLAAAPDGSVDQALADRLIAEIAALDAEHAGGEDHAG